MQSSSLFFIFTFMISAMAKRILVTGGNKGVGLGICERILKEHPEAYVLLGSRDQSRGEAAVSSILAKPHGLDSTSKPRVEFVCIDTSSADSVSASAASVAQRFQGEATPLYGLVNNAGVGFGLSVQEVVGVNVYGTRRVCEAFLPLIDPSQGRVVNIASASGPMYLEKLSAEDQRPFLDPDTPWTTVEQLVKDFSGEGYGFSKALVNLYTMQLAKAHPQLLINSCTPGFIQTDMTAGMGATGSPEEGAKSTLHLLFGQLAPGTSGWYFGSDAVRSPLNKYRGPGDPPYKP